MKDTRGKEVSVGDLVLYGIRGGKGARGEKRIGTVTEISKGLVSVNTDYCSMRSGSFVKVTGRFADLWESGDIYDI